MTSSPQERAAGIAPNPAASPGSAVPRGRTGRVSSPSAPVLGGLATPTSQSPRVPRSAPTGIPGPVTAARGLRGVSAAGRVRRAPAGGAPSANADGSSALSAGQMAIAAAMSEDRGPDWWPRPPAAQDIYVRLTLDLEPVPKERHRTSAAEYTQIGTQRVKTRAAHSYTPQRLEAYEAEVGWLLRQARVKRNDTDDLGVHAVFHVRGHQPDIDNLVKSLFDACNGVAWRDDRQVTCLTTGLVRGSDHPHTALMIYVAALAGLRGMA